MTEKDDWLSIAKTAYDSSTTYVDANYRKKWEDAINMFQSKHPADSKYNSDAYKHRSKLFRPKTRSVVRKHEAAAASAFFSNMDVVSVDAVNQNDKGQAASAALMKEILNYRLTKTVPWYQIVLGGFQDALTVGVVCSYQYWKYRDKKNTEYTAMADEFGPVVDIDGQPVLQAVETREVIEDKPCIELMPVENVRIDPGADWIDPINSSPYVIRLIPMYVCDVRTMMDEADDKTGAPKWKKLTDGEIRSASKEKYDSTRQIREGRREDSKDQGALPEFEIVWVHENFVRRNGEEIVFYTMGTEFQLTDPKPLKEVYFHGERPIVMGVSVIEAHKVYPDSISMLGENLQRAANEIQNQRLDNVKLVLNKRYIAKRGAQVDLKSLVRNVAGSVTLANDVNNDVREISFADVTGSAYQEQDRVNVDYDELTGNFAASSIQTNRTMNETVGGMQLLSSGANSMVEYTIRTFTETWMERVLRQLVKLEQAYETDEVVLAIAADRAGLFKKYGIDKPTDDMMNHDLTLTVNVGMGATDPRQKLGNFMGAMSAYANIAKLQPPGVDIQEIGKEVFGLAGYRDGKRFMMNDEEGAAVKQVISQAQQMIQQAQQHIEQEAMRLSQESQKVDQAKADLDSKSKLAQSNLEKMMQQINAAKQILGVQEQLVIERINSAAKDASAQGTEDLAASRQIMGDIAEQVSQLPELLDGRIQQAIVNILQTPVAQ